MSGVPPDMPQIKIYPTYESLHIVSYFSVSGHKKSNKVEFKAVK